MCDYPVEVVEAMWTSHGAIVRVTVAPNRHSSSPLVLDSGLGGAQHFGQAIGGTGVLGPAQWHIHKPRWDTLLKIFQLLLFYTLVRISRSCRIYIVIKPSMLIDVGESYIV